MVIFGMEIQIYKMLNDATVKQKCTYFCCFVSVQGEVRTLNGVPPKRSITYWKELS